MGILQAFDHKTLIISGAAGNIFNIATIIISISYKK